MTDASSPPRRSRRWPGWPGFALIGLTCCGGDGAPDTPNESNGDLSSQDGAPTTLERPIQPPVSGDRASSDRRLQQATAMSRAVRHDDALRLYRQAVESDPASVAARIGLGWFLLEPTRHLNQGEALLQFRTARSVEPSNLQARAGEGVARQQLGDHERALELLTSVRPALRTATETDPQTPNAKPPSPELSRIHRNVERSLARIHRAEGDLAAADAALQHALRLTRSRSERAALLVDAATVAQDDGRLADAEQRLREAVALAPTTSRIHHQLSRLHALSGRTEEARRSRRVHEILRQFDERSKAFREDADQRVALRRELVELLPENPRGVLDVVREMLDVQRYDEAVAEVDVVAEQSGWSAELRYLRARGHAGAGRLDAAHADERAMRSLDAATPAQVTRDILDEWKAQHDVDDATYQRTLRAWSQS